VQAKQPHEIQIYEMARMIAGTSLARGFVILLVLSITACSRLTPTPEATQTADPGVVETRAFATVYPQLTGIAKSATATETIAETPTRSIQVTRTAIARTPTRPVVTLPPTLDTSSISRQPYPAPVLGAPVSGYSWIALAAGFEWHWAGSLKPDEHFEIRTWQKPNDMHIALAWVDVPNAVVKRQCLSCSSSGDGTFIPQGDLFWAVAVVRGTNGKFEAQLSPESESRWLKVPKW
jgi:hypothetical protein